MKKLHFPNLNGLRFIAATMVLFPHIEQFKGILGLTTTKWYFPHTSAKLGVVLFFTLSGFLITYLLLKEKSRFSKIDIKGFYVRRILRIWPLYLSLILLGFFVLPKIDFLDVGRYDSTNLSLKNFLLYLFFLPNAAFSVPFIAQAWSIGVEEQFYIIWPVLTDKVKNTLVLLISVIVGYFALYALLLLPSIQELPYVQTLFNIIRWLKIDTMAIGGIFALLFFQKSKILPFLYSRTTQLLLFSTIILLQMFKVYMGHIHFEVYSLLFGILILNLATNPNSLIRLETPWLDFLGRISYGLYMLHPIAIVVVLKVLLEFGVTSIILQYSITLLLTILMAAISYQYFEKFFLSLKSKYARIQSG